MRGSAERVPRAELSIASPPLTPSTRSGNTPAVRAPTTDRPGSRVTARLAEGNHREAARLLIRDLRATAVGSLAGPLVGRPCSSTAEAIEPFSGRPIPLVSDPPGCDPRRRRPGIGGRHWNGSRAIWPSKVLGGAADTDEGKHIRTRGPLRLHVGGSGRTGEEPRARESLEPESCPWQKSRCRLAFVPTFSPCRYQWGDDAVLDRRRSGAWIGGAGAKRSPARRFPERHAPGRVRWAEDLLCHLA